jgi:hypothetical protein
MVEVVASARSAVAGTRVVAIARVAGYSGCGSLAGVCGDQAAARGGPTASGGGDLAPGSRDGAAESLSIASGTTHLEAALAAASRWATCLPSPTPPMIHRLCACVRAKEADAAISLRCGHLDSAGTAAAGGGKPTFLNAGTVQPPCVNGSWATRL